MSPVDELPYLQAQAELLPIFEKTLEDALRHVKNGIVRLVGPIEELIPKMVTAVNSSSGVMISPVANDFVKFLAARGVFVLVVFHF